MKKLNSLIFVIGIFFLTFVQAETVMMKPLILKGDVYEWEAERLEQVFTATLPQLQTDNNKRHDNNLHLTVLTKVQAEELFQLMANKKNIPFQYTEDGCYARAHRMARIAQVNQIQVGKVFLFGELRPNPETRWTYHVAPIVAVEEKNQVLLKVIDPSLHSSPVLVHQWVKRNHTLYTKEPFVLTFTNRYIYGPNDIGEAHRFFSVGDLMDTSLTLRKYRKKLKTMEDDD